MQEKKKEKFSLVFQKANYLTKTIELILLGSILFWGVPRVKYLRKAGTGCILRTHWSKISSYEKSWLKVEEKHKVQNLQPVSQREKYTAMKLLFQTVN